MIDYVSANWPWLVIVGLFVAMHLTGHGCGMHGGHHHEDHQQRRPDVRTDKAAILDRSAADRDR